MLDRDALKLLGKEQLVVTGPLDMAKWNYSPLLSSLQRARFRLIVQLIASGRYEDLLEVGYGSGIFMPELQRWCTRLHGVDIHPHADDVRRKLAEANVAATLHVASVEDIPVESASMDLIVSVSALEYVSDKRRAASEIHRVLRPQGRLAVVYPLPNLLSDGGLKVVTGESAAQYGDGRHILLPSLCERLSLVRSVRFPAWMPRPLQVYEAALMAPRN